MKCKKCGAELEEGAAFCGFCGATVTMDDSDDRRTQNCTQTCPYCGAGMVEGATFCGVCGRKIDNASAPIYSYDPNGNHPGNAKDKNKTIIVILIVVVACMAFAVAFLLIRFATGKPTAKSTLPPMETMNAAATAAAETPVPTAEMPTATPMPIPTQVPISTPIPTSVPPKIVIDRSAPYVFPSDTRLITTSMLDTLSRDEVRLVLNEMYARHGYIFTTDYYKNYFASKSWYHPIYTSDLDAQKSFNSTEWANKATIVNYETSKGWR